MGTLEITRRSFVGALGGLVGGLALGIRFDAGDTALAAPQSPAACGLAPNVFVHIAPDGIVSIVCHRSEMGQGIRSSLPVVLADELGADWSRVRVVQGDGDVRYGDQNTDGSRSVRGSFDAMRVAGATARTMLVAAAAQRWGVSAARLVARDHAVHDVERGRSVSFGDLAAAAAAQPVPSADAVALRPDGELRRVGRELPLIDAPAYVTGQAVFGADVRLPGMLTAVIARPPVVGGTVARLDESAALKVPGVRRVVRLPSFAFPAGFQPLGGVAVIADHTWAAMRGRTALVIDWNHGPNETHDSDAYKAALQASVRAPGQAVRAVGDVEQGFATATRRIEAEYHVPHLTHSSIETPVAVARVDERGCEIWAATQNPQAAQTEVAKAVGLQPAQVTVHVTFLGGGFGRKSKPDYVVEAALLAREAKVPVRVQWTRDDEIRHAYYHSCSTQRLEAGLDAAGRVVAWRHRVASPSIRSTFDQKVTSITPDELGQGVLDLPLAVPAVRVESCEAPAHVRIGWLRSVHNINSAFAVQSFISEIAAMTNRDPREVLLEVLGPARVLSLDEAGVKTIPNYGAKLEEHPVDVGRLRHVIERVTDRAGWTAGRRAGRALGLAAHRSFLASVAAVVAVSPDTLGLVQVDEVWITADAGRIVNPDRVRAQLEGAVVFGISLALFGAITMRRGAVEQTNFRDYRVARIGDVPRGIHVELVESQGRPGGVGEPGVPPIAPAIANAVFALTGQRVRELPLRRMGL